MPTSRTDWENSGGGAACVSVALIIKDASASLPTSPLTAAGECVTLICSREQRLFINVGMGEVTGNEERNEDMRRIRSVWTVPVL